MWSCQAFFICCNLCCSPSSTKNFYICIKPLQSFPVRKQNTSNNVCTQIFDTMSRNCQYNLNKTFCFAEILCYMLIAFVEQQNLVVLYPRMHDESESIPQGMRVDVKCNRLSFSSQRRNVLRKRLNNLPFVRKTSQYCRMMWSRP